MQSRYRRLVAAGAVLLAAALCGCVNPLGSSTATLSGTVVDNNGNPVVGARVKVARVDPGSPGQATEVASVLTDATGGYTARVTIAYTMVQITVTRAGMADAVTTLENSMQTGMVVNVTMGGAPTLSEPLAQPDHTTALIGPPVVLSVRMAEESHDFDAAGVKAVCRDAAGRTLATFSLHTDDTVSPALYRSDEIPSSVFTAPMCRIEFTGTDKQGNPSNSVTVDLVVAPSPSGGGMADDDGA